MALRGGLLGNGRLPFVLGLLAGFLVALALLDLKSAPSAAVPCANSGSSVRAFGQMRREQRRGERERKGQRERMREEPPICVESNDGCCVCAPRVTHPHTRTHTRACILHSLRTCAAVLLERGHREGAEPGGGSHGLSGTGQAPWRQRDPSDAWQTPQRHSERFKRHNERFGRHSETQPVPQRRP